MAICLLLSDARGADAGLAQDKSETGQSPPANPTIDKQFTAFLGQKKALAQQITTGHRIKFAPGLTRFFEAGEKSDWENFTNAFNFLARFWPHNETWPAVLETYGFWEQLTTLPPKYSRLYADRIISSIPAGSIYFGGTDPGRYLVTGFCTNHAAGKPFYVITQNALADSNYLAYLKFIYDEQIKVPSIEDSQNAYASYLEDTQQRKERGQLKPGEEVRIVGGRVQVSGQVSVMAINALIAKTCWENNPDREFFIEESFPLEWMNPYLEPHGLIMKLNRKPVSEFSPEAIARDRQFWDQLTSDFVGEVVRETTTVAELCEFAERIHLTKDLKSFTGSRDFVQNKPSQKTFSKCRSAIGGLYAERAKSAKTDAERRRMRLEATHAFKQAWVLCPDSPEAVFRFINLLLTSGQTADIEDALRIARLDKRLDAGNLQVEDLANKLEDIKKSHDQAAKMQQNLPDHESAFKQQPTFSNAFTIAQVYLSKQRTNDAVRVLSTALEQPKLTKSEIVALAGAFVQLNQMKLLRQTLVRLTKDDPENAEAWYDLAGVQALLAENDNALESLGKALQLSDARLAKDPKAKDLRREVSRDGRFNSLKSHERFKALLKE